MFTSTLRPLLRKPFFNKLRLKFYSDINSSKLVITQSQNKINKPDFNKPISWGTLRTDYMLEVDWAEESGWDIPRISPYHNLQIDPRNSSLHYAIQLFEGLKAYRNGDRLILFRPDMNMKRLLSSASRIGLPSFNSEEFTKCIEELLRLEKDWVPEKEGYSIYIRPTFISMTDILGVTPAKKAKLFVILSPVSSYYGDGFRPVNIVCSQNTIRSWPGGFGYAKLGANYGPTLQYYKEIKAKGYDQVLWLINDTVTEVGVMNFFVYWKNTKGETELVTCPLDGTILAGITRDTIIEIAKSWGINVSERHFTIQDVVSASKEGRLIEAFGTGTAAVVCPIKSITYKEETINIGLGKSGTIGDLGQKLYESISSIHYGKTIHPQWSRIIKV